jgi:L-fucose isomerase-like protein
VAALGVKRQLQQTKFLVYQDDPGEGFQAPIFKRFYWWEDECTHRMQQKFGLSIVKRSFRELGARARSLPDALADEIWRGWDIPTDGLSDRARRSAAKLYLAVREDLDSDPAIGAVGINCLNESHFSDTTPCLAWNMLYRERGLIWGCEADTLAMLTKFVLHKSLGAPVMMTNMYPFLLGDAALKHERIAAFPRVDAEPENHILVAHCGYMGVIPQPFATEWTLRNKVLAIVNDNAVAIDARLPTGDITLAKLMPTMDRLSMTEGRLAGYAQFPGSDCLNGGVIRVRNGRKFMQRLGSHHYLLLVGHHGTDFGFVGQVFGLTVEEMC